MTTGGANQLRRRVSPSRNSAPENRENRGPSQAPPRSEVERRSKQTEDCATPGASKGKGKARHRTPPLKKKKVAEASGSHRVREEASDDDADYSAEEDTDGEEDVSGDTDDSGSDSEPDSRVRRPQSKTMKKPVTLDINGLPWGNMKECLGDDIKKYAKSLDPTANWECQPSALRSQLFKRLYKEWNMLGQSYKLSEKWVGPIVTKVLITTRWRLNTLIDAAQSKPADVTQEQWNTLVRRRSTEDSQVRSEHMRSISQGKGSKVAQLKAIERDVVVKLTLQHNRRPYQAEISDEVAREYTRQQLERRKASLQKGADMEDVRNHVVDMEESVSRLEGKFGDSQKRIEDMLKAFMTSQAGRPEVVTEPLIPVPQGSQVPQQCGPTPERTRSPDPRSAPQGILPGEAVAASSVQVGDGAGPNRTQVPPSDDQVEDFLKVLLQEQDEVLGLPKGVKSADTVLLSSPSEDMHNIGGTDVISEVRVSAAEATMEDTAVDSSVRVRRSMAQTQQMRSTAQGGPSKVNAKGIGGKTVVVAKSPQLATKGGNAKKSEAIKKNEEVRSEFCVTTEYKEGGLTVFWEQHCWKL